MHSDLQDFILVASYPIMVKNFNQIDRVRKNKVWKLLMLLRFEDTGSHFTIIFKKDFYASSVQISRVTHSNASSCIIL